MGEDDPEEGSKVKEYIDRLSESMWDAWTFMANPGTHVSVTDTRCRLIGCLIILGGILFFPSILGVTDGQFEARQVQDHRKQPYAAPWLDREDHSYN